MRVLVVAEGKHELSGALEGLLKRLGGDNAIFELDRVSNKNIHAIHAIHGKGSGYFKRAFRWLIEAEKRGFDALILLVDEDGERERIEQIQESQDSLLSRFPRAMGVAIRTFDAWMLADEKALTEVLDYDINKQADPETISNPKQVCEKLLEDSQIQMRQREMYEIVSSKVNIDILCDRCQSGFRPFATNVRKIFQYDS